VLAIVWVIAAVSSELANLMVEMAPFTSRSSSLLHAASFYHEPINGHGLFRSFPVDVPLSLSHKVFSYLTYSTSSSGGLYHEITAVNSRPCLNLCSLTASSCGLQNAYRHVRCYRDTAYRMDLLLRLRGTPSVQSQRRSC
jgi:hypothetical protein